MRVNTGGRVLAVALGVSAAVAIRRRRIRWSILDDPCGSEGLTLPEGELFTLTTDDGADLAVLVAGDGPVVVLPHCWTGGMSIWAPVARGLVAGGHRVVLYDQRGHGSSTLGTGPISIDRLGLDLAVVLERLDVNDVVLAGHSMGGMTIQALAKVRSDVLAGRVSGVVLASTAAHTGNLRVPPLAAKAFLGEARSRRLAKRPVSSDRRVVGAEVHRSHLEATQAAMLATSGAARAGFLVAMSRMDYRPTLDNIQVPTRLLVGTRDALTPPRRARELNDGIRAARLDVLPDYGHMLPLEAPEVLIATIEDLVRQTVTSFC